MSISLRGFRVRREYLGMNVGDLGGGKGSWKPPGDLKVEVVHNVAGEGHKRSDSTVAMAAITAPGATGNELVTTLVDL